MNKTVVVSTTNNPDYYFYAPFVEKAWNALGWNLLVLITEDVNEPDLKISNPETIVLKLPSIKDIKDATIAQAGRLYAANCLPDGTLLMTSDMDLIPLTDYWHPKIEDVTVYGFDLTGRTTYPMGYIAMSVENWSAFMNLTGDFVADFKRDCAEINVAYSLDWEKWWNHDQLLITKRLKPIESKINFIDRGRVASGLALGRIDRADWFGTQNQQWIDAHCENNNVMHADKLNKFLTVFEKVYGKL